METLKYLLVVIFLSATAICLALAQIASAIDEVKKELEHIRRNSNE